MFIALLFLPLCMGTDLCGQDSTLLFFPAIQFSEVKSRCICVPISRSCCVKNFPVALVLELCVLFLNCLGLFLSNGTLKRFESCAHQRFNVFLLIDCHQFIIKL
jgi:hypothetical protein